MKITGQILKENRERKGISISEVALATKINNRVLIAMEEGDTDSLPPKTFLRGFVVAYASYLQLNVDEVLKTFYEEVGSTKPKTDIRESSGERQEDRDESSSHALAGIENGTSALTKFFVIAGILLLVALIVYFKNKMDSYESEAVIADYSAQVDSLTNEPASPSPVSDDESVAGLTTETELGPNDEALTSQNPELEATASLSPTPEPSPTATPEATPTPTPEPSPTPSPSPVASPTPSPTPTATPSPTPAPSPTPSPTPSPIQAQGRPQEIIIEAFDNVDVEMQIDGGPAKRIRLSPDQIQTIKAQKRIVLSLSDGGAVNIIVNGVERGVPGDLGKPKRIELP